MRMFRMLGVAAQAEGIRLRRSIGSSARQAGWIAGAALFGAAALVTAHVALVAQLAPAYGMAAAAGIVALGDLAIAGILALLSRRRADPIAEEARMLREAMLSAAMARDPLRDALGLALGNASAPLLGAVAAEAVATWLKRR